MQYFSAISKWKNDLHLFPRQTTQHHSSPSLCPDLPKKVKLNSSVKTYRSSRTNIKKNKRCPFHHRGLEFKSRKSRGTQSSRQIWPWSTTWSRAEANKSCQGNTAVTANAVFQQHRRQVYTRALPKADAEIRLCSLQLKMEKLCTVGENKTWSWVWLRSWVILCKIHTEHEESRKNH